MCRFDLCEYILSAFGRIYNGITASGAGLLGSVIFIVAYSFLVLVGGNFLKNLGIDDGSNFLLRSAFMGRMLARSGHTLKTKLDHAAETTTNAIAQGAGMVGRNWADRYHSTYQNTQPMPEMAPGNINEGKPPADRIETVSGKGLPDRSLKTLGSWANNTILIVQTITAEVTIITSTKRKEMATVLIKRKTRICGNRFFSRG